MVNLAATKATDTSVLAPLLVLVDDLANYSDVSTSSFNVQRGNNQLIVSGAGFIWTDGPPTDGTIATLTALTRPLALADFTTAFSITGLSLDLGDFVDALSTTPVRSDVFAAMLFQSDDVLTGSGAGDRLYAYGGNDTIAAGLGNDFAFGGEGNDTVNGEDGDDQAFGGIGNDIVNGGAGDDFLGGEEGNDTVRGGAGIDTVEGGAGFDKLFGGLDADILKGGAGKDLLVGGRGLDHLYGGAQGDRFDFDAVADSAVGANRDVIHDFRRLQHDRIDLKTIDAVAGVAGNQAFVFIGSDSFAHYHATHPGVIGMVRFAGGVLQGNVNGNLAADFEIKVMGAAALTAADLVL